MRLLLFVLPFVLLWLVGPRLIPRDVALTIASAMLGVQLVGPYSGWTKRVVAVFADARSQHRHPLEYVADAAKFRLTADRVILLTTAYEPVRMPDGTVIHRDRSSQRPGRNRFLTRLWVRASLERSWNRHFRDIVRMYVPGIPYGPAAVDLGTLPQDSPWSSMGIVRAWHRVRASRTLEKLGAALLETTLQAQADLPARNLATELRLPYDLNIGRVRRPWRTAKLTWRAYRGYAS